METPVSTDQTDVPEAALAQMSACSVCGRMILTKNMVRHRRQVHGIGGRGRIKESKAACPECGARLTVRYLPQHRRTVHGTIIPKRAPGRPRSSSDPSINGDVSIPPNVTVSEVVETIVSIRFPERVPTNMLAQVLELEGVIRRFLES